MNPHVKLRNQSRTHGDGKPCSLHENQLAQNTTVVNPGRQKYTS